MLRTTLRYLLSTLVVILIAAAVLFSLARILFPVVGGYRSDIEAFVSRILEQQVRIGDLDARWHGVYPALRLNDVQLLDDKSNPVLAFKEVRIDIDWLALLSEGRVQASTITVVGSDVRIERDEQGRVGLAGVADNPDTTANWESIYNWLLSRKRLALRDATIRWHDRMTQRAPMTFSSIQVDLRNEDKRHRLSASGALPTALGRAIKVSVDVMGDPVHDSAAWEGSAYIKGEGLQLHAWNQQFGKATWQIDSGTADIALWPEFRQGMLQHLAGEVASQKLTLSAAPPSTTKRRMLEVGAASGRVNWTRTSTGWRLGLDKVVLSREQQALAPMHAVVHYDEHGSGQRIQAYSSALQLETLAAVAAWWPGVDDEAVKKLIAHKPFGRLQNLYIKHTVDTASVSPQWFVKAEALDTGWRAANKVPGIEGVDGMLVADNDTVFFALAGRNVRVNANKLFRNPIQLSIADGWLAANKEAKNWRVFSQGLNLVNADMALDLEFSLDNLGGGVTPEIDLVGRFRNGRGANKSLYLPAHIMPESLVHWLDKSIVGASVPEGGVVVRGPLNKFPFAEGDGRFEVRFIAENGQLDFAPNWPRIEQIKAEVSFNEKAMNITSQQAATLGLPLDKVSVEIADMIHHHAVLNITGHAQAPLQNGLKYLTQSPLKAGVGVFFAQAKATGSVNADLAVRVPLFGADRHAEVAGKVNFSGNSLVLEDSNVDIERMEGNLRFTDNSVAAEKLRAIVLGQPAVLTVRSEKLDDHIGIVVMAQGQTRLAELRQRLQLNALNWVEGETDWRGELRIGGVPQKGVGGAPRPAQLAVTSSLVGVQVKLPPPFGKPAAAASSLDLHMTLPLSDGQPMTVAYGENLRSVFEFARSEPRGVQLTRGEVRFFEGAAMLPERRGIRVGGTLPVFNQTDWQHFLLSANEAEGVGSISPSGMTTINQLDVVVHEAKLLGRAFGKLSARGELGVNGWNVQLLGDRVEGQIMLPAQSALPVRLDLERLELTPAATPAQEKNARQNSSTTPRTDPRTVPALQLRSKQFVYENRRMGALALELEKIPGGVRLASSALDDGVTRLKATGSWTAESGERQLSQLDAQFQSSNVGRALAMFGYAETIRDGIGQGAARITWPDSFDAFAPGILSGTINFKVEKGRVLDVEPGAGRIFGLLSVQALPRRLTLDFSDFFAKGFSFDKVEGDYALANGIAHTNSFKLGGPAAQIDIEGEIDLKRRTYDQKVKVVPNLTGSLPVLAIGVGVVATPIAGAAAFIAEKLLRKPVGKLTQVTYGVTGPWDNPTVQFVGRNDKGVKGPAPLSDSP